MLIPYHYSMLHMLTPILWICRSMEHSLIWVLDKYCISFAGYFVCHIGWVKFQFWLFIGLFLYQLVTFDSIYMKKLQILCSEICCRCCLHCPTSGSGDYCLMVFVSSITICLDFFSISSCIWFYNLVPRWCVKKDKEHWKWSEKCYLCIFFHHKYILVFEFCGVLD